MPEMLFHGTLYLELQKDSGKVLPAGEKNCNFIQLNLENFSL